MSATTEPSSAHNDCLTDHYESLCHSLRSIEEAVEDHTLDQLVAGEKALAAVLTFLNSDPRIVLRGSNRSLSMVLRALNDILGGGRPSLLFERPSKGGAPTDQAETVMRAQIVLALEMLLKAGVDKPEAGAWVAGQLQKFKIRRVKGKRQPITPKENSTLAVGEGR